MIVATHTARDYQPDQVRKRYVKFVRGLGFQWCEVGENRWFDLRQGKCLGSDLPVSVMDAALDRAGTFPSYVDWPL